MGPTLSDQEERKTRASGIWRDFVNVAADLFFPDRREDSTEWRVGGPEKFLSAAFCVRVVGGI